MLVLTWWIVGLTVVLVLGLLLQILLAINYSYHCSGGKVNDKPWTYICTTTFNLGVLGKYSSQKEFIRDTPLE